MSSVNLPALQEKAKSFWSKPEGKWGMALMLPVAGLALWGLSKFVFFMLHLALGLLGLGIIAGVIIALLALVFTDNPLRQAIILKYQVTCRNLRNSIIDNNPITVLNLLQTKAKERLTEVGEAIRAVMGNKRKVDSTNDGYKSDMVTLEGQINQYRKAGNTEAEERALGRWNKLDGYSGSMTKLSAEMETMIALLRKAEKVANNAIEDADFEIKTQQTYMEATNAAKSAWTSVTGIFKGNTVENEIRTQAFEAVTNKISDDLGKIDGFMMDFKDLMVGVNATDAVGAEQARVKLEALTKAHSFDTKAIANQPAQMLNLTAVQASQKLGVAR